MVPRREPTLAQFSLVRISDEKALAVLVGEDGAIENRIVELPRGVEAESLDQEPVRLIFLVVSPEKSPAAHLQTLAAISRWLKDAGNLERIQCATTVEEARRCLCGEAAGSEHG